MTPRQFVLLFLCSLGIVVGWSVLILFSDTSPGAVGKATTFLGEGMVGIVFVSLAAWGFGLVRSKGDEDED